MKVSFESIVFPCGLIKIALLCEISGKENYVTGIDYENL